MIYRTSKGRKFKRIKQKISNLSQPNFMTFILGLHIIQKHKHTDYTHFNYLMTRGNSMAIWICEAIKFM